MGYKDPPPYLVREQAQHAFSPSPGTRPDFFSKAGCSHLLDRVSIIEILLGGLAPPSELLLLDLFLLLPSALSVADLRCNRAANDSASFLLDP